MIRLDNRWSLGLNVKIDALLVRLCGSTVSVWSFFLGAMLQNKQATVTAADGGNTHECTTDNTADGARCTRNHTICRAFLYHDHVTTMLWIIGICSMLSLHANQDPAKHKDKVATHKSQAETIEPGAGSGGSLHKNFECDAVFQFYIAFCTSVSFC